MAGRPSSRKVLDIWMNGEFVGHWTFTSAGGHSFSYDSSWLDNPQGRPLSLSLPLSQGTAPFSGSIVESYFDNLLPDSQGIRKRLASKFGTDSTQAFQLLEKIGRVRNVKQGPDGNIYVSVEGPGRILQLIAE